MVLNHCCSEVLINLRIRFTNHIICVGHLNGTVEPNMTMSDGLRRRNGFSYCKTETGLQIGSMYFFGVHPTGA